MVKLSKTRAQQREKQKQTAYKLFLTAPLLNMQQVADTVNVPVQLVSAWVRSEQWYAQRIAYWSADHVSLLAQAVEIDVMQSIALANSWRTAHGAVSHALSTAHNVDDIARCVSLMETTTARYNAAMRRIHVLFARLEGKIIVHRVKRADDAHSVQGEDVCGKSDVGGSGSGSTGQGDHLKLTANLNDILLSLREVAKLGEESPVPVSVAQQKLGALHKVPNSKQGHKTYRRRASLPNSAGD